MILCVGWRDESYFSRWHESESTQFVSPRGKAGPVRSVYTSFGMANVFLRRQNLCCDGCISCCTFLQDLQLACWLPYWPTRMFWPSLSYRTMCNEARLVVCVTFFSSSQQFRDIYILLIKFRHHALGAFPLMHIFNCSYVCTVLFDIQWVFEDPSGRGTIICII